MANDILNLDRDRIRELFDLRSASNIGTGGGYRDDPHPAWHELRASGPVHAGVVHELTGYDGPAYFWGCDHPEQPHYSAFSFETCDRAFRDNETFGSTLEVDRDRSTVGVTNSMLTMGGKEHRRYRSLVQPSFIPAKAKWWRQQWIDLTVEALIDSFIDEGRADLNVDFCAAIPMLTITGSFGIDVDDALDLRNVIRVDSGPRGVAEFIRILAPVVAARREHLEDDLPSILVEAEFTDEDGHTWRLSDEEIYSFSYLLLSAGSGTTWKQMGITLAALLTHPEVLEAARNDDAVLRASIEESLRWVATDPAFPRFVRQDVELGGQKLERGTVLQLCLGAANHDPARWERPDEFDPSRPMQPSLAFGNGPHVCLGMHVARAEMFAGISALLRRLPNLRLDPDAEPPAVIGMYERGVTQVPVLFDRS